MTEPYGALLVGCGPRGQAHARALSESERFDLRGVCDLDRDRVEETAESFGVDAEFVDLDRALDAVEPVHVSCATPPSVRTGVVAPALDRDVESVLVEKPMANSFEEVRELERLASDAGVRFTVCFETLWADEIRAVKDWIDEGDLGDVRRLVGTTKGGLAAQGSHFLHMLDWLLGGTPVEVRTAADGPAGLDPDTNPRIPDHVEPVDTVLELTYPNDERAFCHFGAGAPDEPAQADSFWLEYRLDVIGTDGSARFVHGGHAHATFDDGSTERVDAREFDEDAYMTRGLYDRLGSALSGEVDGHPADLDSAVTAHRTIDAAMRSAERSRAIPIAREPPSYGPDTTERLRRELLAKKPITVSTLMYGERDRSTTLDALAELGVESVDLWSMSAFAEHFEVDESPDAIADGLAERGLEVPVVSLFDDGPIEPKLDVAAELGAEAVVMGGRTPERPDTWDPERLETWLDAAAERHLTIAFENHLDTLETVDEMEALLDALDHPAAGICLAPTHLHFAGERAEEALTRLGDDVAVLYLWDVEPGANRADADEFWWNRADSQVPGGGAVDFERLLDLAVEYAPEAPWVMCYHGTEEWDLERIQGSVARGLRYAETRRP